MRFYKFIALAAAAAATSCAFADAADTLVSFSTTADKYADGTAVKDGEWYALGWSQDGDFSGLGFDCTPVDANDKLLMMAPLAKGGRCPYTVFQVDSKVAAGLAGGVYTVVLLDTRGGDDGKPATTKPTKVYAAVTSKDYQAGAATEGTKDLGSSGGTWASPDFGVAEIKNPVIKDFKVIGDAKVSIEVKELTPNMRYRVQMGPTVDKIETLGEIKVGTDTEATFVVESDDARFFKVVPADKK